VLGCTFDLRFQLAPHAFKDPEFIASICQPPPPGSNLKDSPVLTSEKGLEEFQVSDMASVRRIAFHALLEADLGHALGLPLHGVAVKAVAPLSQGSGKDSGGEKDWEQDWAQENLEVTVQLQKVAGRDESLHEGLGQRLLAQWNNLDSWLHRGAMTSLIDYSKGASLLPAPQSVGPASSNPLYNGSDSGPYGPLEYPGLLVGLMSLACFLCGIPVCSMLRRCTWQRQGARQRGGRRPT
ncbi:unnamed protein product, partial [Discosporangium mesarthrocarpum]